MKLAGKSVLITGAGSGIGRALAREASARGMRLMLTGRRLEALRETKSTLPYGAEVYLVEGDVTKTGDRLRLRDEAQKAFGGLDVLLNNAGVQSVGPLEPMDDGQLEAMVRTNLLAPMALTRDLLGLLEKSAPSRIVNVGSMFGDIGFPLFAAYSATKFGMRGFSDALRRELKDRKIGVTYAAPRATQTPAADQSAHLVEPMKMTMDRPENVAAAIWNAVEREARSVYPFGPERLFVLLQRLIPAVIDNALVGQLRQVGTSTARRVPSEG